MRVVARDDDVGRDGQLTYSIRGGSGLGHFHIDDDTGVIYTTDVLDRETQDSYWLTVYATDMGVIPQSAVVHVYIQVEDVNDNAPLTSDPMYHASVLENSPKDLSIIQISAQDPDATPTSSALTFRIASGNTRNLFSIHPHTGLITTTSKKLDREQQAEHFLEVLVSDGGVSPQQALVCVCVSVLDVNDNSPVFLEKVYHARVPERRRMSAVTRVFARDRDQGANAALTYTITDGNPDARFHIHPKTGLVTARKTSPAGVYDILTIKAVDGGRPQRWASARLHIEWVELVVSDSAPFEFVAGLYNFSVMETERVGEIVGVVSVKHSSAPVWFEITGSPSLREVFSVLQVSCGRNCSSPDGDDERVFAADRAAGTIITTRALDAELNTFYNLSLEATDGTHTTRTQVHITVLDSNDNPPVFSQSVYDVVVSEDTPPGAELLRVTASDRDLHGLTFDLQGSVDPASLHLFRIEPSSGAIHTTHTLDHESNTQHILTVMVKEAVFPFRKALCRVLIGVEDVNDHAPLFTMAMYEGRVYESAAIGSALLTVTALDRDRGANAHTLYSIDSGNTGGAFSMDPVLGVLSVEQQLDSSVIGHYVLSVRATDGGTPPLSSTAAVHVAVVMSDNSPPRFALGQYHAQVSEGVAVGTSVVTVTALSRSTLTYQLRHGPASPAFAINQYSGTVVTRQAIDFERDRAFALTVVAADMTGREAVATVTVTVLDRNDNSPEFLQSSYRGNVSEGAAPGTLVADAQGGGALLLLANDADSEQNGQLAYQIADEQARPFFTVDMATGALRTTAPLDHETTPTFRFQVSVRDRGRPWRWGGVAWVQVDVLDENDTPPRFSQSSYSALLLLPTYEGVELLTLPAHDPDSSQSELRFSLTDGGRRWAVGAESGVLSVRDAGGWEAGLERVGVSVSDGRFSSAALVSVTVRQAQEAELRFSEAEFRASVPENKAGRQLVTVVTAVGGKLNEPLRFSLLNGGGIFQIGHTSGAIETVGVALDREQRAEHRLVVQVSRSGDPLRVARATVHVSVTDENDNTPLFIGLPYYAAIQVDADAGTVVCVVSAVDLDFGPNGHVNYFLSDDTRPAPFLIDAESGQLKLSRPFEPDLSNAEYQVVVFARDQGQPPLSSSVSFTVTVVNRAMPVFDKTFYTVRVSEDVAVSTPILGINASCPEGQTVLYTLSHTHAHTHAHTHTHTLPEGPPAFSVGFETGVISVAAPLDHETSPAHRLVVRATAGVTGAHAEVEVEVTVSDVNDNTPTFRNPAPHARIAENAMIGTPVIQVQAVDLDSDKNGVVRYQLLPEEGGVGADGGSGAGSGGAGSGGAGSDWFHLDSASGLLLTARRLDRELVPLVRLRVRAQDQGFPPRAATATVTVEIGDVNDNAPVFGQLLYEARVSEGAEPGQPITRVWASDADAQAAPLRYSLLSGDGRGLFRLHPLSGVLALGEAWPGAGGGARLREELLALEVGVSDGALTSSAQVHVSVERVNTHGPAFTQRAYEGQVAENAPPGSKVGAVRALDADPGPLGLVRYRLLADAARRWFSVDAASGLVTTATRLDRETLGDLLEVTLVAEDAGGRRDYSILRVTILDENDNTPHFRASEYRVSVSAHTPAASLLTQVMATDADSGANARLAYSLYSEASQPITALLDIDVDSGWLVTRAGAGLEAHEGRVLSFFVKAADAGAPPTHALVPVYVHVLGHAPSLRFSQPQYSFTVPEDTPIGATVGVVKLQAPPPGAVLSVAIGQTEDSNRDDVFVIDESTGALKLQQPLDRERVSAYFLRVSAFLPQQPIAVVTSVEVELKVLDVNDHAPLFEAATYQSTLPEDTPPGTPVIQVRALDPDWAANGQVVYSLTPPTRSAAAARQEGGALFVIDRSSGWISTLGGLDHELSPFHSLTVWACDLGEPVSRSSSATVSVLVSDVNDNPPIFLQPRYHGNVRESDAPGEVVTVINTRDDDSSPSNRQVTYHITGGDVAGVFGLGVVQGEWKLYVRTSLDREAQDHYIINVTATDGLHAATTSVHVTVTDTNDNTPVCDQAEYSVSVAEDVSVGSLLLRVRATDADLDANAAIRYSFTGDTAQHFNMHPHTGELTTAVELDRETRSHYALVATAMDGGGLSCSARLSITLLDVNDNAPQFSQSELTASVYENTPTKALITRIQAIDPDLGSGGRVVYSLLDSAGVFSLDAESGVLSLERALDREQRSAWRVCVSARDLGTPPLSSSANLTVSVLDVNDNPPVFARRDYLTALREDVAVGTEVLRVHAASKDIGTNADIYYSIRHGNQLGHFSIHINTGAISVWRALDFEACSAYFLTVEARDGGTPPLSAVAMVNINVTDVNDNAPVFSRDAYSASLREDAAIGDSVVKVTAEDMDSPLNGAVQYSIAGGDREQHFFLEPITGLLRVNKPLDRETVMAYSLSVCARDSGSPPLSSTAVVNIEISDINDNPPTFSSANHTAVIQENTPTGTSILQLSVTDRDSAHNGPPFLFHILSGNEGAEFHLDKEGLLTSNQIFKREVATQYTLQVQVWDSGRPSLSSGATVVVRVIEESVHPPSALPLQVHIVAMEDEFPGGVIGQIHASDMDTFDVLTFGHTHQQNSLFKVSPQDGRVMALSGLDGGVYSLNVTVSDGRFSVSVPVSVHVEGASPEMLLQAVTLRFDRVAPPTFLQRLPELRRRMGIAMATPRPQLLHVLSLQPVETGQLDLLVAVETPDGGFYKAAYVSQKLAAARRTLDQVLRVSAVLDKNCSALDCRESACEQHLELDSHSMQTHSTHTLTHTLSYVTPRFLRHTRCVCTEGMCAGEGDESVCAGVCPVDMQCVSSFGSSGYSCQCPPGKLDCAGHSSLSFSGSSFIKYGVSEGLRGGAMRVSLRIRTLQSWGIIMYTHTHACTQLKLEQGELWFQVDCGIGLPNLGISGRPINDGRWHHVTVELRLNHSSLSLDDSYVEQRRGPLRPLPPGPDWLLVFGAGSEVGVAHALQERRDRRPALVTPPGAGSVLQGAGFQGCLDALQLNGQELPLQDKRSAHARVLTHAGLTLGCSLHPDACQSKPCRNGGTCSSHPTGGFWCSCGVFFTGVRCEVEMSVCVPNPCKNAGQCRALGNAFLCSCRRGYTGLTCEEDVNECEGEECENGGVCVNTFGSFFCNCSAGFVGRLCGRRPVLVPNMQAGHAYLGREELIGMATVLSLILLLVLTFVALRKRLFRKSPSRLALDPAAAALLHKTNGAFPPPAHTHTLPHTHTHAAIFPEGPAPPQVPVRPMAYTPCFQGNEASRGGGTLEKGAELTEMSTFHPSQPSPRILGGVSARRGVVVCSVAPNLPPTSPCHSDCDSLHKSPWHSDQGKGEETCFGGSHKSSNSEVQSLSSFQSDSCDDNASIVTVIRLVNDAVDTIENEVSVMDQTQAYNRVYHWDTSDWMPSTRLPDIEEVSAYESADTSVAMTMGVGADLETDYYLGGAYDIDSETPPPQGEELQLSPPMNSEHYDSLPASQPVSANTTLSRGQKARPQFHPSQYLPPHQPPLTDGPGTGEELCTFVGGAFGRPEREDQLSINTNSASDVSTPCRYGDSETDSLEETQQQTEV
ncbi:hypothetical protein ACEWY4_008385 [Coilia grayii]|uniref:Uncharacterized protein n=1 Tax=Coilia grayii TaxID=363190 RepID=A0ABD1KAR4_9TELE